MTDAAKAFRVVGQGKKTYHATSRATLFVEPEFIPVMLNGNHVTEPSKIDRRVGKTSTGVAKPTNRPLFKAGHRLRFLMYVKFTDIPPEVVRDILIWAGRRHGIGDYRPEHGRFEVERFELLKKPENYDEVKRELAVWEG